MESIKGFFDSFKEFIWDIIGYLLPGSYILILLSVFIEPTYFITPSLGANTSDFYIFIFISISYLLGHVVYGFGLLKEHILGKDSYTKKIEKQVASRKAFSLSKKLLANALKGKELIDNLETASIRDLRSIAMSFIPEHDQKIYGFMFRSELSNHTGNISFIIGILGLFFTIFSSYLLPVFKTTTPHLIVYVCLILSYIFLRQTRDRFYAIAIGLPFSIYTAKQLKHEL